MISPVMRLPLSGAISLSDSRPRASLRAWYHPRWRGPQSATKPKSRRDHVVPAAAQEAIVHDLRALLRLPETLIGLHLVAFVFLLLHRAGPLLGTVHSSF